MQCREVPFWAAAPKGSMTYAFTQIGNFLLLLLPRTPPLDIEFLLATLVSLISSCIERGISYGLVTALYFHTRLDTWLHQSRAGRQEQCWRRSQEHLGRSSGLKKFKNAKKVIVAKVFDGQRYPCPA